MAIYWKTGYEYEIVNAKTAYNYLEPLLTFHNTDSFYDTRPIYDKYLRTTGCVTFLQVNNKVHVSVIMEDTNRAEKIKEYFEAIIVSIKLAKE